MQLLLSFSLLSLLSFIRVCYGASCSSYSDCSTCASSYVGFWPFKLDCLWCPLDRKCHTWGSQFTPCLSSMNINDKKKCPASNDEGTYSASRAYTNTLLSAAAYGTNMQQCLDHVYPENDFDVKETIAVRCDSLYSDYDECIAFTSVSPSQNIIAVGFRGSISSEQVLDQGLSTLTSSSNTFKIGGKVLDYFANAHNDMYPCIKDSVEALIAQYPGYKIVVTGHSLGGALASLTAASLVYDGVASSSNLELYTFGLPRVGEKNFAYNFDKLVRNSWNVVNYRDIVPHLPFCNVLGCNTPYNGPFHHKREVYYALNGNMEVNSPYTVCEENEDDRCSNGAVTDDICFDLSECIDFHLSYFNIQVGTVCEDGLGTAALPRPWNNQLSRTCSTFQSP